MSKSHLALILFLLLAITIDPVPAHGQQLRQPFKTRNVILIVSDGLRWQEIFTGAEKDLLSTDDGRSWASQEFLLKAWWRETLEERRKALFPFNELKGSPAHISNSLAFSYPGYNEMLTGVPDPRINANEFGPNPNRTVFEWLNSLSEFRGQVTVFGTWKTFRDIFNESRSHLPIYCGWALPYPAETQESRERLLNDLFRTTTKLDAEDTYDSSLQVELLDYLKNNHPRVLFVGYGETDNWTHSGRYDLVLESAHNIDLFVEQLWNTLQSLPQYKNQTTLILTNDHGRGSGLEEWKEHGTEQKGSENIWLAVIGPDTPPLGERTQVPAITQAQIAATVAALLGQNYRSAAPNPAPPIADVLPK
jgi:hypothetical protein